MEGQINTPKPPRPENYLAWAIVSACICWPFGIPAIVNAAKVNTAYNDGDYAEAEKNSLAAKKWAKIGTIVGAVCWGLYILFFIIMMIVGVAAESIY